jgi:hypothetical protein
MEGPSAIISKGHHDGRASMRYGLFMQLDESAIEWLKLPMNVKQ